MYKHIYIYMTNAYIQKYNMLMFFMCWMCERVKKKTNKRNQINVLKMKAINHLTACVHFLSQWFFFRFVILLSLLRIFRSFVVVDVVVMNVMLVLSLSNVMSKSKLMGRVSQNGHNTAIEETYRAKKEYKQTKQDNHKTTTTTTTWHNDFTKSILSSSGRVKVNKKEKNTNNKDD